MLVAWKGREREGANWKAYFHVDESITPISLRFPFKSLFLWCSLLPHCQSIQRPCAHAHTDVCLSNHSPSLLLLLLPSINEAKETRRQQVQYVYVCIIYSQGNNISNSCWHFAAAAAWRRVVFAVNCADGEEGEEENREFPSLAGANRAHT